MVEAHRSDASKVAALTVRRAPRAAMIFRALVLVAACQAYTLGPAASRAAPAPRRCSLVASEDAPTKVGVLAIQGGFAEHMQALSRYSGVEGVEVRTPSELAGVDALILPGGESTSIGHGLADAELLEPVREFVKSKPAWGICAGLILLAEDLDDGASQPLLGGLDITVKRNAFGRQSASAYRPLELSTAAEPPTSAVPPATSTRGPTRR